MTADVLPLTRSRFMPPKATIRDRGDYFEAIALGGPCDGLNGAGDTQYAALDDLLFVIHDSGKSAR